MGNRSGIVVEREEGRGGCCGGRVRKESAREENAKTPRTTIEDENQELVRLRQALREKDREIKELTIKLNVSTDRAQNDVLEEREDTNITSSESKAVRTVNATGERPSSPTTLHKRKTTKRMNEIISEYPSDLRDLLSNAPTTPDPDEQTNEQ